MPVIDIRRIGCGFNPRTHEGCDFIIFASALDAQVSIHAPMKGATRFTGCQAAEDRRFNPRTHEGCDAVSLQQIQLTSRFNPRTHEGCDAATCGKPAMGTRSFNPRTHEGCDFYGFACKSNGRCFNPRTHEGCDLCPHPLSIDSGVSIHAPMKGATSC